MDTFIYICIELASTFLIRTPRKKLRRRFFGPVRLRHRLELTLRFFGLKFDAEDEVAEVKSFSHKIFLVFAFFWLWPIWLWEKLLLLCVSLSFAIFFYLSVCVTFSVYNLSLRLSLWLSILVSLSVILFLRSLYFCLPISLLLLCLSLIAI